LDIKPSVILAQVRKRILAQKGNYGRIERRHRIPKHTLAKIACGATKKPTLEKLLRVSAALDKWEARNAEPRD
jgi:hypothetical protein